MKMSVNRTMRYVFFIFFLKMNRIAAITAACNTGSPQIQE